MKPDPTRTKILIISYERDLKRLLSAFWKDAKPKLIKTMQGHIIEYKAKKTYASRLIQIRSAVSDLENILHESDFTQIRRTLKPIVRKYNNRVYKRAAEKAWVDIKKTGAVTATVTYSLFPIDIEAIDALVDHNYAQCKGLTVNMKKDMLRIMTDGVLRGESIPKMTRALSEIVTKSKKGLTKIVRTETNRAYNQGAVNQYKKAGLQYWEWIASYSERTCEVCASLDGKVFKIGAEQPPKHCNCRCSVLPVFK